MTASAAEKKTNLYLHIILEELMRRCAVFHMFEDPHLQVSADASLTAVTITADAYARSVEIQSADGSFLLEDNFFDMEPGSRTLRVLRGKPSALVARSVYDIR